MFSRIFIASLAVTLLASAIAAAQPSRTDRPQRDRPGRDRPEGRRVRDFGPNRPMQILDRMKQELRLDQDQVQRAQPLFAEYESTVRAIRESVPQSSEDGNKYREMREEIQAAREAGDNDRLKQILDEMRAVRESRDREMEPIRLQVQAAQKLLHDNLQPILRAEQKSRFKRIWDEEFEGKQRPRVQRVDPRVLKSIVDELSGLSSEQKREIDIAFRDFREASRKPDISDSDNAAIERTLTLDVFAVLNDEQSQAAQAKIREQVRKDRRERARDSGPEDGM